MGYAGFHRPGNRIGAKRAIALLLLLGVFASSSVFAAEAPHASPDLVQARSGGTAPSQPVATVGAIPQHHAWPQTALLAPTAPEPAVDEHAGEARSAQPSREALARDLAGKWADLEARIRAEEATLAACHANYAECPGAARRLLHIIELGRQRKGRAGLAEINRAVNMSIRYVSDETQHGVDDYWSSPLATLAAGAGDCEDYAIVKYVALREAGMDPNDLRLLIVRYPRRRTNHAILLVRQDKDWLILDNLTLTLVNFHEATHYRPLFALDQRGVNVFDPRDLPVSPGDVPATLKSAEKVSKPISPSPG
jgi:predicted transglutaminase-like cysteine proteinase